MALAVVMALGMTACGGAEDSISPQFSVQAVMEDMLGQVSVDDPLTLGESDLLDFFGIKGEWVSEFAAVTCANGISAQEIVLVKAVDEAGAAEVADKLNNRLNNRAAEAENYLPDQYAIISACQVQTHGVYTAMIIHPEHEQLEQLYLDYVNGK